MKDIAACIDWDYIFHREWLYFNILRLLGTHHTKYLWQADSVILLHEGSIKAHGCPEEILTKANVADCEDDVDVESSEEESSVKVSLRHVCQIVGNGVSYCCADKIIMNWDEVC